MFETNMRHGNFLNTIYSNIKTQKYFWRNISKGVLNVYAENYKLLLKENKTPKSMETYSIFVETDKLILKLIGRGKAYRRA
jgi:hypothetical protein